MAGLEIASGWRAVQLLSGDFFKISAGPADAVIVLGDAKGKGPDAAVFGAEVLGRLSVILEPTREPARVLARLNGQLAGALPEGMYSALLVMRWNGATRELTVCNAGCPYPLLVRNGESKPIRVEGCWPGYSLTTDYSESETIVRLAPGDLVIGYSDGVSDQPGEGEAFYGDDRLGRTASMCSGLSASEVVDAIFRDLTGYCSLQGQFDDQSIAVLRVLG